MHLNTSDGKNSRRGRTEWKSNDREFVLELFKQKLSEWKEKNGRARC